ncbi:MAG: hypothetical protein M3Z17_01520 [Gemmatimonadota bacterium]|nr:hypothetical protein [Gemmatimonadota bacterium]
MRSEFPEISVSDSPSIVVERPAAADPPRLSAVELVEHRKFSAVEVGVAPAAERTSEFGGFLDGAQKVQVLAYPKGIPVVLGTVSAAMRCRTERRLMTWREREPAVERRLYLPLAYLGATKIASGEMFEVVDTSAADATGVALDAHPLGLVDRAVQLVQESREALENRFAEDWCDSESTPLFIDGGISGSARIASSPLAIGVVKSHRTLYVDNAALPILFSLRKGERSSVFRVAPRSRHSVASWYLRIRSSKGQDPLWGLVRVEIADTPDASDRANEISRWILAESSPLSLPDGRWDKMAYGIRDTEEFLRAIS